MPWEFMRGIVVTMQTCHLDRGPHFTRKNYMLYYGEKKQKNQLPHHYMDFPGGSDGKVSVHNAGDEGSIPGSGRSPGEGNGNPLQYYCLENPMDRGAW